jgi:hypothetical protein
MRRLVVSLLSVYLLAAIIGRVAETQGRILCGCEPDCWCKKPVLSVFRWVFPYGHRGPNADQKADFDSA